MNNQKMNDHTWTWAKRTQLMGVAIALIGLLDYLLNAQHEVYIKVLRVALFLPPFAMFGGAEWRSAVPQLSAGKKFIITAAYINTICLFFVVFLTGGNTAVFAPLFLLVPHTTSLFLRETRPNGLDKINVVLVTVFITAGYVFIHLKAPEVSFNTTFAAKVLHTIFLVAVLLGTVLLTTYLAWVVPHQCTCSPSPQQEQPNKS